MEPDKKIRLPLSRTKRSQITYAKLLKRVDPRSRSPFQWEGKFFNPGTWILESQLWPDGTFPRHPLLLEFAGAEKPARGWNRHQSENTVILWVYERTSGEFLEVGRVHAPGGLWASLIEPLVRDCLSRDAGEPAAPDLDAIRARITRVLSAELNLITDSDRYRVLCVIHDELAGRIAEWSDASLSRGVLASLPS